ncbi:hypothetical protein L2E82_45549 [Cichorium intybus]|uniref:Uncharacterized protein n=1 Tax=Cichorium intybus TaxID=13427 RepID=A0ACB8ZUL7_CICIN|nr:hypothetical protein L2E82_45549 [Cichorium intybus]
MGEVPADVFEDIQKDVQDMEGCFGFDLRWVHARLGVVAKARFDTHDLEEYAQTSAALEKATSALAQLEGELSRRSETASAHLLANSTPGSSGDHISLRRQYVLGRGLPREPVAHPDGEDGHYSPSSESSALMEAAFSLYKLDGISLTQGKRLASINGMKELNQEQKDFQSQSKGIHLAGVYAAKTIRASSSLL